MNFFPVMSMDLHLIIMILMKNKNKILENSSFLSEISDTFTGFIGDCKNIYKENVDKSYIKIYKGKNIKKFICYSYFYYDFKDENIKGGTKDLKN
ncbi:hypothetical protein JQ032_06265 [Clostridium botulinum]|nr:hypothetical protein [Clostridium botulinum]